MTSPSYRKLEKEGGFYLGGPSPDEERASARKLLECLNMS